MDNSFYSKINVSGRLRTKRFSSCSLRVRVTVVPFFKIFPEHFSTPELSERLKVSPTSTFNAVIQNFLDGKYWYPPPLLSKLFLYPNLKKHQRVPPYGNVRHCEIKNIRWQILISPSSVIHFFSIPKLMIQQSIPPKENFGTLS